MGERLEMEIVGKNSTAKGWDQVEQDAKARARRIQNAVGAEGGIFSGKTADKSMSGKGFSEAFLKAFRGDFSGALEDITARMSKGMQGLVGKATLWGAGVATAFAAGWKAGGMLDEMLGISDKVAKAWNKAAVDAGKSWDVFYKSLRAQRVKMEAEIKAAVETDAKVFDIREKSKMKRMSPFERADYLAEGISTLEHTSRADGASLEEQNSRKIMLEEMKADYQDALDEMAAAHGESVRASYEAEKAAEAEKTAARKHGAEVAQEFAKMGVEAEIAAIEEAMKKRQEQNVADMAALDARKAKLQELAALEAQARAAGNIAADPQAWKNKGKQDKADAREKARRDRMHAEAEAAQARGVKLPPRMKALLDADHAAEAAAKAGGALKGLNERAAEAQIKAQEDMAKMRAEMERLSKLLQQGLSMGGEVG